MKLTEFLEKVDGKESDIKNLSNEEALEKVMEDGYSLQYVREQKFKIILAAMKQNFHALQFVREEAEEMCLAAVKQNGDSIEHIENPSLEVQLAAVKMV